MDARRLYVVTGEDFGEILLGPAARRLEIAAGGELAGMETVLVGNSCSRELPAGMRFVPLTTFRLEQVRPQDALVVSAYLSGRWLLKLLRSKVPFHVDLYCVTATEILPTLDELPKRTAWHLRWRRVLRYAALCARAESVYLSNDFQTSLLAGTFFGLPGRTAQHLSFELPSKVVLAPMAPPDKPFPLGSANPYPDLLQGRPIFLWGGGIWKWFDASTALDAFALLKQRGSDAALYFLAGRNASSQADQDLPHWNARELARLAGTLDTNVFFNERRVGSTDLPAYLEHCHAGILCNGPNIESLASWRTRQLDLLWAGKPALVSGADPLSRKMADAGACWIAPARNPEALADLVQLSMDLDTRTRACEASARFAWKLSGSQPSRIVADILKNPDRFRNTGTPADPVWILRYIAGF
jgi:glycosyltransferase involved in cell wall biosynthesis